MMDMPRRSAAVMCGTSDFPSAVRRSRMSSESSWKARWLMASIWKSRGWMVGWMSFMHDVMTSMLSRGIATIGRNSLACGTPVVLGDATDARSRTQVETEAGC